VWLARCTIVCAVVLLNAAGAFATPLLTVARILHDGVSRDSTPGLPLKRNQTLAPTSRISVPDRVVVIIAYGKSTATLAANTVAVFNWTSTLEQVIITGGKAIFDDPLDVFRVSAHLITASHHSTIFAFDVNPERVTVTCTEGKVLLSTVKAANPKNGDTSGSGALSGANSQVVRTDALSDTGTASITYRTGNRANLDLLSRDEAGAAAGDASAEFNLGARYGDGQGVPRDYGKARHYYELAAAQGYAVAQNNLGYLYHLGYGVPQDYGRARYYYELALAQGYDAAQNNLGALYEDGQGVPQDYSRARYYYEWPPPKVLPQRKTTSASSTISGMVCARTTRGRATTTSWPPPRAMTQRKTTSATSTITAKACPRTTRERATTTSWPLPRGLPERKTASASCTISATGCGRTTRGRATTTSWPPPKVIAQRRPV